MDDLWSSTHSFMDLVDWHHRQGGTHLFVDEIHYLKTWQQCLENVNLMNALSPEVDTGCKRETYFLNQLRAAGHAVTYPAAGDFRVEDTWLFEVGGKGKSFEQVKDVPKSFVAYDDVEVGRGNKIPLLLFGFLY